MGVTMCNDPLLLTMNACYHACLWKLIIIFNLQDAVPEDQQKEELMESISKGNFTLRILYEQLANIQKMGPVGRVMSMIPGLNNSGLFNQVLYEKS